MKTVKEATEMLREKLEAITDLFEKKQFSGKLVPLEKLADILTGSKENLKGDETITYNKIWNLITEQKAKIRFEKFLIISKLEIPICDYYKWKMYDVTMNPLVDDETLSVLETKFDIVATRGEDEN